MRQLKELYETELLNALEEQRSRHSYSRKEASGTSQNYPAARHALATLCPEHWVFAATLLQAW